MLASFFFLLLYTMTCLKVVYVLGHDVLRLGFVLAVFDIHVETPLLQTQEFTLFNCQI